MGGTSYGASNHIAGHLVLQSGPAGPGRPVGTEGGVRQEGAYFGGFGGSESGVWSGR